MKMICTHKCFVLGRSVKEGQLIDIPEAMLKRDVVLSSFATPEAVEKQEEINEAMNSDMSVTEYRRRLEDMGVTIPAKATKADLKKLYVAQASGK